MKYCNVIIIDDDEDDREILLQAINDVCPSASCTLYNDSENALQELINETVCPDAIFLDINMPKLNGIEFLELIKTIDYLKEIAIIIYSTTPLIEVSKSKLLKVSGLLEKPDSYGHLVEDLRKVL